MFVSAALAAFALIASVNGFYSSNDDVVQLDPSNFDRLVVQSSDLWIIEFYAPWCGRTSPLPVRSSSALFVFV